MLESYATRKKPNSGDVGLRQGMRVQSKVKSIILYMYMNIGVMHFY